MRTFRRTDMTKLIVPFCNFAKAPEKRCRIPKLCFYNFLSFNVLLITRWVRRLRTSQVQTPLLRTANSESLFYCPSLSWHCGWRSDRQTVGSSVRLSVEVTAGAHSHTSVARGPCLFNVIIWVSFIESRTTIWRRVWFRRVVTLYLNLRPLAPFSLQPRKNRGWRWIGRLVGPIAGLDV